MKKYFPFLLILSLFCFSCTKTSIEYPVTKKVDTIDVYYGTKVPDPYRWLEDDNSEETAEWVKAQNEVTFSYLEKIPYREKIKERLTDIWNYARYSTPWKQGGYYFFSKNDGLQNQSVYYIQDDLESEPRIIIDPNTFSEDGTVALTAFSVSKDGKYIGYGTSSGGSDWREFHVRDIASGTDLDDFLKWIKFSGFSWYNDGFFYGRYEEPEPRAELTNTNTYQKIYYHKIGTNQSEDKLFYKDDKHPDHMFSVQITEDEKFLFLYESTWSDKGNALYYKDQSVKNTTLVKLFEGFDYKFYVMDHINGKFLVFTDYNAPMNRLLLVDPVMPDEENWKEILPERDYVLEGVSIIGGKLVANFLKDAHSRIEILKLDGTFEKELELPALGTAGGFSGKRDENIAFYSFTSFTFPSVVYKYNMETHQSEEYFKSDINFNSEDYETKQVFYESKDGTKIPMFIVNKKGIELNGNNPALLYGYGGFNISQRPYFSITRLIWLENGGVFAFANLRGGGEYGEEWHKAGIKMNKQNVFDDFIYAAKYLIREKYTSHEKLAIQGASNGGLLVGAAMNQAPELFKVAFPAVGVMDMLRFHKFTIGGAWVYDYGSSDDNKEMFKYLYGYSPLHNIQSGVEYPATLVTTADHDDRVVPAHSFKYISTLQEKYKGKSPVLIRIETRAGHGGGKPTSKIIEEQSDIWSFAFYNMGITPEY
jgi:prolyl oligopeptidase